MSFLVKKSQRKVKLDRIGKLVMNLDCLRAIDTGKITENVNFLVKSVDI